MSRIFLICLALSQVNSMSIEGPALTRYDPCGLGIVHFDKITKTVWRGIVNFNLYPYLISAVIDIQFERQVQVYGSSQNTSISVGDDWHNFIIRPRGALPKQYFFYLRLADNGTEVPTVTKFSLNNATLCNDAIKTAQTIESLNRTVNDHENYKHACGRRSLEHAELTSVRTESEAGDWPWHVALLKKDLYSDAIVYECGGSIISRTAILTAGHCVSKGGDLIEARRVVVVAGVNNHSDFTQPGWQSLIVSKENPNYNPYGKYDKSNIWSESRSGNSNNQDPTSYVVVTLDVKFLAIHNITFFDEEATEIVLHPGYSDDFATSDLAIIRVQQLRYTAYVQPICIWGPVYDKTQLFGKQATVVGFGYTENNQPSEVLRSAYTMVQNDSTCITYSPAIYSGLLNEFTFCAGYGETSGINPRNGDSGGGLVVGVLQSDHKISWFIRGVLSKCGVAPGHTECDPKYYVVYTDVGPHYSWLYHHSGLKYRANIV